MATDSTSRLQVAFRLLFVFLVVAPLVVQSVAVGRDVLGPFAVELLGPGAFEVPSLDPTTTVQTVGLAVVAVVALLLVRQERGSRGQQPSDGAPGKSEDRDVKGSGEVYAPDAYRDQHAARRESKRIQNRAEEIAEAERDAHRNRRK
jgi:membrane protein implicated in regulation of membrane protease activity